MKRILLIATAIIALNANVNAQESNINNQSVKDMIGLGFSEDIIISKIEGSECDFNTDIEALKALKEAGVSDEILKAMLTVNSNANKEKEEVRTGIFYNDKKILPTVFSGTKTNTLGASFSYGIASAKIKSVLNGATSNNVVETTDPTFMFVFSNNSNNAFANASQNWWFTAATSPNEFVLVKLSEKKNKREMNTGKVNVYSGTSIGIDEKYTIPFNIEAINDYTFKVKPKENLESGEYCFFYQGTIPQGGITNQSVFDFSIK